jgi:photosystem II stability/assembly factor-like uncharacterized protein
LSIVGTVWRPRGPSPINSGGRDDNGLTTAIAVHPGDSQIAYVGTAGGGVWKTGDGGATWRPLFDRQASLAIGEPAALAIDPNDADVIYAGTSGRGRVSPQRQAGLFKSTDGGASWVLLGSGYPPGNTGNALNFATALINVIIVDPANSAVVYLAASTGVWRSTDGGQNWKLGTGSVGDARSLVLDRTSPAGARILYAGLSGQGVVQSTDGGQSWSPTPILDSATPAVAAVLATVPGATITQVVVDLAPPTAPPAANGIQVIYVAIAGRLPTSTTTFPDPVGLFVSINQGATWTKQAATNMTFNDTTTYGGYCTTLAVDPTSPGDGKKDVLLFGCRDQGRSKDSGASFTRLSGLHPDTHSWCYSPSAPATVYCGTDGGVARSDDGGVNWVTRNAGRFQTGLIYNLDVKPDATASASAAAFQDNGLKLVGFGSTWSPGRGNDGWDIVYSGTTPSRLMASTNAGGAPQTRVFRSDDDGINWTDVTPFPNTGTESGFFLANLAADPSSAKIFYAAGNVNLWQTQDAGATPWRPLTAIGSGFVTATVAVAPTDGNSVVVANGSTVLVSTDALGAAPTFTDITRNLPGRNVLRAAFDPNDATVIYAVLGGFAGAGASGHVFRTTVTATSWTDISPDLDVPFGALALDGGDTPTTLYVGTDLGVLRSVDRGSTWTVLDDLHFPRAAVTDLVLGRGSRVLRAATYGRGAFEFVRPDWPSIAVNLEDGLDLGTTCDGQTAFRTLEVFNVGTSDLVINSVQRLMGSTGFVALPNPGTPLVVRPGEHVDFTIAFTATTPGTPEIATIRIVSNDPDAPTVDLLAVGLGEVPGLATVIVDQGDFGAVCLGEFVDRDLVLNNTGACPLHVQAISSTSPAFEVPGVVSYPLVVAPGDAVAVPIRFRPAVIGPAAAVLRIDSDDPGSPAFVRVSGTAPAPRLVVSIADTGTFPDTCLGDVSDEMLTLSNSGPCPLTITAITSSSVDFLVPQTVSYPVVITAGGDLELTLRFQPTSIGHASGTIAIVSDDPAGLVTLDVSGHTPSGRLTITGTADFGPVRLGDHARQTLSVCNTGDCDLHVTRVAFRPPCPCDVARRSPCGCGCGCGGGCGGHGDHHGPGHGENDDREDGGRDDGHGGHHGHSTGHGCRCDQKCLNFRILTNPFPATVHPGSCLGVLIEYVPTCDSAACCELVIESDDPTVPRKTVLVTGHLRRTLRSALKCWAAQELHEILEAGNC